MPRALKDPVGFRLSAFTNSRPIPYAGPSRDASSNGVEPSPSVTTFDQSRTGSTSCQRQNSTHGCASIALCLAQCSCRALEVVAGKQRTAIDRVDGRELVGWIGDVTEPTFEMRQRGTGRTGILNLQVSDLPESSIGWPPGSRRFRPQRRQME